MITDTQNVATPARSTKGGSPIEGVHWPVGPGSLSALVDMGMSDEALARYFGVDPSAVRLHRRLHGIGRAPGW